MACSESMRLLKDLNAMSAKNNSVLMNMAGPAAKPNYADGKENGWNWYRVGKSWFYTQRVTYAGTTQTVNLDFPMAVQVNRIEQKWNDTTAKDFEVRHYSDPSQTSYAIYLSTDADANTSVIIQAGIEYKYGRNSRMQFFYENYTVGKILDLMVQVDEL